MLLPKKLGVLRLCPLIANGIWSALLWAESACLLFVPSKVVLTVPAVRETLLMANIPPTTNKTQLQNNTALFPLDHERIPLACSNELLSIFNLTKVMPIKGQFN
jgi:hypothetical protein